MDRLLRLKAFPTLSSRTAGAGAGRAAPRLIALAILYLGFVLAQVTPGVGVGDAQAITLPAGCTYVNSNTTCATREQSWTVCNSRAAEVKAAGNPSAQCFPDTASESNAHAYICGKTYFGQGCGGAGANVYWSATCAAGETWKVGSHTCWSSAKCVARNDALGSLKDAARPSLTTSRCVAECDFAMSNYTTTLVPATGQSVYRGVMKYTGLACTVSPTNPAGTVTEQQTAPVQECTPVSGSTVCIKGSGEHCVTTKQGRQMCWRPFEVGEKTDANVLQVRNPGSVPSTPTTPPPPGDTLAQSGDPITTTTTDPTRTATTTFTNYTTVSGVDAGTSDQGGGSDGSTGGTSGGTSGGTGDASETNSILTSIKDKVTELFDGLKGDGQDHSGDGADPGDSNVWSEDQTVDASALDTGGMGGGEGSCPPPWTAPSEGVMASSFLIEAPQEWCDFVSKIRTILILFAVGGGIVLVWKN